MTATARRLPASGAMGRPLTASAYSTTARFGSRLPGQQLYLEQPEPAYADHVLVQVARKEAEPSSVEADDTPFRAALRDDRARDRRTAPDFDHAVRLAHLVDAVLLSDARRKRIDDSGWPSG